MATALDKSIVSRLKTSFQATPAVSQETIDEFVKLLDELQKPQVSEAEAEKQLRQWLKSLPEHASAVLQSVILASVSLRILSADSWVYKVFSTFPTAAKK